MESAPSQGRKRTAALVVVAGAFAVVLAGTDSVLFDLERHLAPKALVLHATALLLLALGVARPSRALRDAPGLLLGVFVAWGALSSLFAANRWLALQAWGVSFSALVVFAGCRTLAGEMRWRVVAGVAAAAVLGAALGVAQAYGVDWPWLAGSRAPGGTFGNRNFLAHVAAIAGPCLLALTLRSRRGAAAVPGLLGLAVVAAAVVLTRSRAAWLAGLAGLGVAGVLLVASRRRGLPGRGGRVAAGATVLAAAVAAAVLVPNELEWSTDAPYAATLGRLAEYREGSGRGRLVQYRTSLRLVPERPVLGMGPGNWFVHYPRVTGPGDPAWAGHLPVPTNPWPSSDWVAFVVERGPAGALLLLLAGLAAVARSWRAGRRGGRPATGDEPDAGGPRLREGAGRLASDATTPDPAAGGPPAPDPWAAPALAGTLAAALVAGAFDAVLLLAAPSLLVAAAAGLLLPPPGPGGGRSPAGARPTGAWPRRIALGVSAVLVAVATLDTAAVALTREREDTATLERAAVLAPWQHRLHLELARRGRCAHAAPAARLMPHHPAPRALVEGCGG